SAACGAKLVPESYSQSGFRNQSRVTRTNESSLWFGWALAPSAYTCALNSSNQSSPLVSSISLMGTVTDFFSTSACSRLIYSLLPISLLLLIRQTGKGPFQVSDETLSLP